MTIATVRREKWRSRGARRSGALAILALLGIGCPGDLPTRRDTAVVKDTAIAQESGLSFLDSNSMKDRSWDLPPASERRRDGVTGKSCKEVLDCGAQCTAGTDLTCITTCLAAACPSASPLAQSVYLCGVKVCATDCPVAIGPTCLLCLLLHCPTEYNACLANTSCGQ